MSKIAEQKALEAYPEIEGTETYFDRDYICTKPIDLNRQKRVGYIKGYGQAMQDFLERAERYLNYTLYSRVEIEVYGTLIPSITNKKEFINDFKNYMKDEI